MADFNPDKFLSETAPAKGDFSPDRFLSETKPAEQGLGEKITRGALKSLPYVGGLVGGALGTPADIVTGPLGTVAGAGAGAAAGKSLENILERYMLGDQKSRSDIYVGPVKTGLDVAAAEGAGQIIGQVPNLVKSGIDSAKNLATTRLGMNVEFNPVSNKDAVIAAAKNLGIDDVPKALLTENPTYQKMESGLSQSGSLPAKPVRDQYDNFFKAMDQAKSKISDLKTPDSDFALGGQIQKGLTGDVKKLQAPVGELYEKVRPDLQNISVNKNAVNQAFDELKTNPIFQTKDGKALLSEYKDVATKQPELASLKEWRSSIGDAIGPNSTPLDNKRMDAIRNAVTKIRDGSIEGLKTQLPKEMHGEIDNLANEIALADAAHATNINEINSVKSIVGNKDFSSPSGFINKLGDMKEGDLSQRASNLDVGTMRNIQDKFPQVFDKVKTAKINDMIQRSTNPVTGFNDTAFLKQYGNLDNEMKDLLFDPKMQSHIESLQAVRQATPPKLGPSGTPQGKMMMDMANPKRNTLDFLTKKALDTASGQTAEEGVAKLVSDNVVPLKKVSPISQGVSNAATKATNTPAYLKAADNTELKGRDKWASDGIDKLMKHSDDPAFIKQLSDKKDDPKVKDLLIKASDLKPGSKAMDDIMSKIKDRVSTGGQ